MHTGTCCTALRPVDTVCNAGTNGPPAIKPRAPIAPDRHNTSADRCDPEVQKADCWKKAPEQEPTRQAFGTSELAEPVKRGDEARD